MESIVTLVIASALLLGSPGPTPIFLALVGATVGVRRGLVFLLGVLSGLFIILLLVIFGLNEVLRTSPTFINILQWVGLLYIIFLAWKIVHAMPPIDSSSLVEQTGQLKIGFLHGVWLNLTNPKAYAAILALMAPYIESIQADAEVFKLTVLGALMCLATAAVVDFLWLLLGPLLRGVFFHSTYGKAVRVVLVSIMIGVVALAVF